MEDDIKSALKKCAVGFGTSEVVEEFTVEDGELRLVKKKVTRRDIPPDIKAVKMLMDGGVENLSDAELDEEMKKIKNMLKENNFD